MIISYKDLVTLYDKQFITGVKKSDIQGSSIDVTLYNEFLREDMNGPKLISWRDRHPLVVRKERLSYIELLPGEFVLAATEQKFNLPLTLTGTYFLKSSMARIGLNNLNAGHIDPGFCGRITLELKNETRNHTIMLRKGDPIGQVVFHRHEAVPSNRSYRERGRYMNDDCVQGVKR